MRNHNTSHPPPPAGLEGIASRFSITTSYPVAPRGGFSARVRDRQDGERYFLRAIPRSRVVAGGVDRFRDLTDELSRLGHRNLLFPMRIDETADWILLLRELASPHHLLESVSVDDQQLLIQSLISLTGALGALHEAGHVHGMPKPSRLRIEGADGRLDRAALVDPGLHLLTGSPDLSMQHHYWAPETQDGGAPTPASDLFTLGASFLELAGGRAALDRLLAGDQPRFHDLAPELDADLCRLLDRLIASAPERRPADGQVLWRALQESTGSLPERVPDVAPASGPPETVAAAPALVEENRLLRRLVLGSRPDLRTMPEGICADPNLLDLVDRASHLRPTLLEGETGLGRVRLVLGVHLMRGRIVPIQTVLCSADPDALARTDLRLGPGDAPFERARGGTLVLCGVEELSDDSLAQLEEWLVHTDGGMTHDVWLVGTTRPAALATSFRGRDFARRMLAALGQPIVLPPLRRRLEALPLLIDALLAEACRPINRVLPRVPEQFVELCGKYHWPGNIAELRHVVRHAVALAQHGVLSVNSIPSSRPQTLTPYREAAEAFERRVLAQALEASAGRVHEAARLLGLPESTFRYKARKLKLGIKDPG